MSDDPALPARLTPADHALAHALTLYADTVRPEIGPDQTLGMALRRALAAGCGDNPIARELHMHTATLLRSRAADADFARADAALRRVLRDFHQWRLRLALDRIERGERANAG